MQRRPLGAAVVALHRLKISVDGHSHFRHIHCIGESIQIYPYKERWTNGHRRMDQTSSLRDTAGVSLLPGIRRIRRARHTAADVRSDRRVWRRQPVHLVAGAGPPGLHLGRHHRERPVSLRRARRHQVCQRSGQPGQRARRPGIGAVLRCAGPAVDWQRRGVGALRPADQQLHPLHAAGQRRQPAHHPPHHRRRRARTMAGHLGRAAALRSGQRHLPGLPSRPAAA